MWDRHATIFKASIGMQTAEMVRLAEKGWFEDCVPQFWAQPIRSALLRCHESGCGEGDVLPDRERLAERQLPASGLCRPWGEKRCKLVRRCWV